MKLIRQFPPYISQLIYGLLSVLSLLSFTLLSGAVVAEGSRIDEHSRLLNKHLDSLKQNRPEVTDLYFIGVAPYSTEEVFMNETTYVRNLFDLQFDTFGRSLLLINNSKTSGLYPVATIRNMEKAFQKIGGLVDPEQDMVVLFITSHGDKGKGIRLKSEGVENITLSRKYLDADTIRHFFDDNNIKWRIIILSACFSGGLIETLKNEYSLIITSASSENPSFGCGHHGDFTQFGKTFFSHNLNGNPDFISAFEATEKAIGRLERELKIGASNPQIHAGNKIRPLLDRLADRVSRH